MENTFFKNVAECFYLQGHGLINDCPEWELGRDAKTDEMLNKLAEREGWDNSTVEDIDDIISSGERYGYIKGFQRAVALMQEGKECRL